MRYGIFMEPDDFANLLLDRCLEENIATEEFFGWHPQRVADFIAGRPDPDIEHRFIAEAAYLSFWDAQLDGLPDQEGVDIDIVQHIDSLEVTISAAGIEDVITIFYHIDEAGMGQPAVKIYDNSTLSYERRAGQNPATEWASNIMANNPDVRNRHGEIIFVGEPS